MKKKEISTLSLKWGTLKSWDLKTKEQEKLLEAFCDDENGMSASAAMQNNSKKQKEIICKLIDTITDPQGIYLDWDGIYVSKAKAKKYVMNYEK